MLAVAEIIEKSQFAKVLRTRNYEELSENMIKRLSLNWTQYPEAPLVASRKLAKGILHNVKTGGCNPGE
jgi:hypothetical protein